MWKRLSKAPVFKKPEEWAAFFKTIYSEEHAKFEKYRKDIYELCTGHKAESKVIKKIMQKSYINFASNPEHLKWTHEINNVATEHGKAVNAM
jgi:hypothetical protein